MTTRSLPSLLPVPRTRAGQVTATVAWGLALALLAVTVLRPAPAPVSRAGAVAPAFALPRLLGGGVMALHSLRGRPVLLNFWASYCEACKEEMPTLEAAYRRYRGRGAVLLGVDTFADTRGAARALVARMGLTFPMVVDTRQDVADRYNVSGIPTTVFIDPAGRVRGTVVGPVDAATIRCGLGLSGAGACPPGLLAPPQLGTAGQADIVFQPGQRRAPPFTLTNQEGRRVALAAWRGQVVVLTFVSAICRDQCPVIGHRLARIASLLGAERRRVALVSVSVQPEGDTPQAARAFARAAGLDRSWQYLTGTRRALAQVWRAYYVAGAPAPPRGRPSTTPVHSVGLYLIDPRGDVRAYFDAPTSPRVVAAIRALLS